MVVGLQQLRTVFGFYEQFVCHLWNDFKISNVRRSLWNGTLEPPPPLFACSTQCKFYRGLDPPLPLGAHARNNGRPPRMYNMDISERCVKTYQERCYKVKYACTTLHSNMPATAQNCLTTNQKYSSAQITRLE